MNELKDKLVLASKVYGDQILLRAAINAIPTIGGPIDILLSFSGQNFVIKRIETFIKELNEQVSQLTEDKINKDFLTTEQGFDLIVKAFNSASRTRQQEKLRLYSKIVKGTLIEGKEFEEDEPEMFLRVIEELTVKELKIARCLYELKETKEQNENDGIDCGENDADWLSNKYKEFDKDELISIFIRLERTGLIRELVGMYMGYMGGRYLINPLFKKFMTFIDEIKE